MILELIENYQSWVNKSVKLLADAIGDDTPPLKAWKAKILPGRGHLGRGIEYRFHGIGCCFEYPDCVVDVDFGPGDRHDGFDAWRLWLFADSQPEKYPHYRDQETLKQAFNELVASGRVKPMGGGSYLYCLNP